MASIAVLGGCLPSYDNIPTKGNPAMRKNAEFRSKWNEPGKHYRYTYSYFKGMGSETQRGECIIDDSVACTWSSTSSDLEKSKIPGRISGYFDKMDTILLEMDPDSIKSETPDSYSMIETKRGNTNQGDSLSVPFGYTVYFNAERGYIDSLFFLPFGPYFRVWTMTVE